MNRSPSIRPAEHSASLTAVFGSVWQSSTLSEDIEAGLPFSALAAFLRGQNAEAVLTALRISKRTFERRRQQGILTAAEGDRLCRLVNLYTLASEVLGNQRAGSTWMNSPAISLLGRTPLEVALNEAGVQQVRAILLRIEYGVYA